MREAASQGYLNATDLADYLVRKGMPFREAHEVVGRIVLHAMERGVELQYLQIAELQKFSELIREDVFEILELASALASKAQLGGTAPAAVAAAFAEARSRLTH